MDAAQFLEERSVSASDTLLGLSGLALRLGRREAGRRDPRAGADQLLCRTLSPACQKCQQTQGHWGALRGTRARLLHSPGGVSGQAGAGSRPPGRVRLLEVDTVDPSAPSQPSTISTPHPSDRGACPAPTPSRRLVARMPQGPRTYLPATKPQMANQQFLSYKQAHL